MRQIKAYELAGLPVQLNPEHIPERPPVQDLCFYFDAELAQITELLPGKKVIIITDEIVNQQLSHKFPDYPVISFPSGEEHKQQSTVDQVIKKLIGLEAGRDCFLLGIGGGVVTDITGYVASVYLRGVSFGLVPTTILAMVDAAIGGKNGVDVGVYKNLVGSIRQPSFLFYDYSVLSTLPVSEWVNGFAEVIKHACIKDALLFAELERYTLHDYQQDPSLVSDLIEKNAAIKNSVVIVDEMENGERKLLNFGHTVGHAIENLHQISHGHAVSIGMAAACNLSEKFSTLHFEEASRIIRLLARYHLPVDIETDHTRVFEVLRMDKKRIRNEVNFILLSRIGSASVTPIPVELLQHHLKEIL
ncbi:MAG: 3-dehydroquinate synthase [Chitinophagaceae bacterium]|nr:3-dehydroquinate synthase [Chitinophagaceae bacterium]